MAENDSKAPVPEDPVPEDSAVSEDSVSEDSAAAEDSAISEGSVSEDSAVVSEDSPSVPGVPPSVRLIWRTRDMLARRGLFVACLALLVLGGLWVVQGFYVVGNGESGALLRFGKLIDDAVSPGLHFRLPWGIDEVTRVRTSEVLRHEVDGDYSSQLHLVTGDENLIDAGITVQYRITRLGDYLFSTENVKELVEQTIRSELVESAAVLDVDDLLTSAKALVQQQVRERGQKRLDLYGSGIVLVSVNLQTVDPPREAEVAFRNVIDARAEAAQVVSRAQADRDRGLRLTSGKAAQLHSEAEAEANRRLQAARGAAGRFEDLLVQKRLSPELTRADLYARTVREVLPKTRLIVLAPGDEPTIDVNLLEGRQ